MPKRHWLFKSEPGAYAYDDLAGIEPAERFDRQVSMDEMRGKPALARMILLNRGVRISVQPMTRQEFEAVRAMGRGA